MYFKEARRKAFEYFCHKEIMNEEINMLTLV
jgi:hypothetical protein